MSVFLARSLRSVAAGASRLLKCLADDTHCALCARSGQHGIDLCISCEQLLKNTRHRDRRGHLSYLCAACGEQVPVGPATARQGSAGKECRANRFCSLCCDSGCQMFSRIVVPYRYAFPLDRLIKRVKYSGDRQLTRVLGHLMARSVLADNDASEVQMLIPMPLHTSRLAERGFNQAQDIAQWCGGALGIPVSTVMAQRVEDTDSLAGLNRQERRLRILGVFRASAAVAGKRVAIVDDVLTTGASANELARELYDSGAASIELWVLARTSSVRDGG